LATASADETNTAVENDGESGNVNDTESTNNSQSTCFSANSGKNRETYTMSAPTVTFFTLPANRLRCDEVL
jgi:hypothetical protein